MALWQEALQPLPARQKLIAVALAVAVLLFVLELVRRRKLREEYSVLWVLTSVALLVLALQQNLILHLTALIGAVQSTSTLFFGALVFLMMIALQFSVRLSKLTQRNKALAQRIALMQEELERLGGRGLEHHAGESALADRLRALEDEILELRRTETPRKPAPERQDGVA